MKNQALFSSKDKSKKLKHRLLRFLFGALRVKEEWEYFQGKTLLIYPKEFVPHFFSQRKTFGPLTSHFVHLRLAPI